MKDERDTQRMELRPDDVEAAEVRKFNYRTDPGVTTDTDKELLRGVSRSRDAREDRAEALAHVASDEPGSPLPPPPAVQKVTIVHAQRLPTWIVAAALGLSVAILAVALLNFRKTKQNAAFMPSAAPAPASVSIAPSASSAPSAAPPVSVPSAIPTLSAAPRTAPRSPPLPVHSAVAPPSSAPTATSSGHPDTDIVRTPGL